MLNFNNINNLNYKNLNLLLISIYGIGLHRSKNICKVCGLNYYISLKNLSDFNIKCINDKIKNYIVDDELKKKIKLNIKKLIDIKCYRGIRHLKNLPVRGQRTRSNAKTRKKKKIKLEKNYVKKTINKK